ncbi:TolA-binding protein [Rhizobium sp. BIGb0125]|uniref:hypothetical protein n=1 Tax=Rhizobium sp. BIGb0125 TaxID=2940618 RepID=UPI00216A25EF|nr:hypothetical protein [Rhizobium sp. BIGb0125]MCS4245223.1 TolA-binding protein [Rhizobium sp. BIGb0125]
MLPALQTGSGIIASDLMRSMLEEAEELRQERENELEGLKKDDAAEQKITHDPVTAAANQKINAYFFGNLKQEGNQMAALIGRVASALGITQGVDESGFSFARRLQDAVSFMEMVPKSNSSGEATVVSASSLNLDVSTIISVMDGTAQEKGLKPDAATQLIARLATQGNLSTDDPDAFNEQLTGYLTAMRASLPVNTRQLEETTGLKAMGVSINELISAVASPYGEAAQKIKGILDEQSKLDQGMTLEMRKVIQRLEDVADPKSLEELQQEKTKRDPTEVNDTEVQLEREADIEQRQHAQKLDDVIDMHEAVREGLEQAKNGKDGDDTGNAEAAAAAQMIQLLSAGLSVEKTTTADNDNEADAAEEEPSGSSDNNDAEKTGLDEQAADYADALDAVQHGKSDAPFWVSVDDNGLYELLKRNAA